VIGDSVVSFGGCGSDAMPQFTNPHRCLREILRSQNAISVTHMSRSPTTVIGLQWVVWQSAPCLRLPVRRVDDSLQ
jgi:hypothetical protein